MIRYDDIYHEGGRAEEPWKLTADKAGAAARTRPAKVSKEDVVRHF